MFKLDIKHNRSFLTSGDVNAHITNNSQKPITLSYPVSIIFIDDGYPDNYNSLGQALRTQRLRFYAKEFKLEKLLPNGESKILSTPVVKYNVEKTNEFSPKPRLSKDHTRIDLQIPENVTLELGKTTEIKLNIGFFFTKEIFI